ncbi:bifunctional phosphoribosylaminoimidazolecarboxamide formyltransferase/IMP cyclohydrolase [bacterium]|nr:bifunctional phosphoribosylaminoimidazolecarboxamide formyltransferase/IMP cyclohydrolase [bacterium]
MIKIRRAILSVSDKKNILEIAQFLKKNNVEILSTGGTSKYLESNGVEVQDISDFTGFPEILDGRVKTLHPKIYGGILSIRDNTEHEKQMSENNLLPIDLVICNLYPFEETLKKGGTDAEIIENIDIGGPTMIRAASKNFKNVCVLSNPEQYEQFKEEMDKNNGHVSETFSFECAREVFRHTARYDFIISSFFDKQTGQETLPDSLDLRLLKVENLRYGENPHQKAAWYRFEGQAMFPRKQFQGKELSFNNLLDMEATYTLVNQLPLNSCAIIKHSNPCGAATGESLLDAYTKALQTDDLSAFGGILGFNGKVDKQISLEIIKRFYEVVIAPGYDEDALEIFKEKGNLRIIESPNMFPLKYDFRTLNDGFLIQTPDEKIYEKFEIVTEKEPTKQELEALNFAWIVCKFVKSNAIVLGSKKRTIGIGAGQMSRYDSARIAVMKMKDNFKEPIEPLVMASDAFFPFPDSIQVAKEAGVTSVIQPGGSIKDKEVISACNKLGISMVLTGTRHFKH